MADVRTARSVTWEQAHFIANQHKTEENVAAVIRAWAIAYPHELVALERMTKALRREGGYSEPYENMAHFAEVPATLYREMVRRWGKDWLKQQDIASIFFRHFRVGCLNLRSMPRFDQ